MLEKGQRESFELEKIEETIDDIEEDLQIHYDPMQRKAIQEAIQQKVFILTGGPGTGKTTVINGIIGTYARLHQLDLRKNLNYPSS